MSLLVWIPLIRDGNTQGLLNLTPTVLGNVSYIASGKLGNCLSAGNGSQVSNGLSYNTNLVSELGTKFSCAIWVKPLGNHVHYNGTFISSGNWNSRRWSFGVNQDNTKVDVFSKNHNRYIDCSVPVNTWTHLVCTSDNGTVKLYKNGEYVGQSTESASLDSDADNFCVGRETYASGYFSFNGNINDVRIYNHVLGQKEIKELSKGLVAHYKLTGALDGINPNMFKELPKSYAPTTYLAYQLNLTENLVAGQTYTLHFWNVNVSHSAKSESDLGLSVYWGGGNVLLKKCVGTDYFINGHADHLIFSFTPTSSQASHADASNSWLHIYNSPLFVSGTLNLTIEKWKLEKGSVATPYVKTTEEMGGEDTNIYDCSGYSHHGSALGTLTTSSDTARYSSSTVFDGSNSGVLLEDLVLSPIINNDITYSFWIKPNGENGARSVYFGSYSLTSWSVEKTTGNVLRLYWNGSPDESCSGATITDGVWQHICIAKKGTNEIKVYINGVLKWTSTATHNILNLPTTYRIGRDTRTGATCYCGQMSDFRIYATSLSADDVLELYHTGASVDKNGNMYAYELKEI